VDANAYRDARQSMAAARHTNTTARYANTSTWTSPVIR
jgi:hypothetical protein